MLEDRYISDEAIINGGSRRNVANIASDHTLKVIVDYLKENRVAGYTLCDTVGKCIVIPYISWQALKELVK